MFSFLVGPQTGSDSYHLTRLWIIRGLGFIYFVAFAIVFFQGKALFGVRGLLPMNTFIAQALGQLGGDSLSAFVKVPSLFYFVEGDHWFSTFGILGMLGGVVFCRTDRTVWIIWTG